MMKPPLAAGASKMEDQRKIVPSDTFADPIRQQRLDLFAARCDELVERVNGNTIKFVDAVDMAYSAAVWSGLIDDLGDDAVQYVMARAFMRRRS
jgi:hypothetical protein